MSPSPRPVLVSILTINQAQLLEDCLESLFAHPPRVPFRVHVFDQASTDRTPEVLARFRRRWPDRIDVHRHPENIGFVRANNLVFRRYPDHDVVLLNDDTVLLPGWLDALRARIDSDPRIGIVGARLVYPNGVLQEAGGEVYRDASGRNIGKWDDPARPEYLVAADVDYCSGACLYVRREVLDATGGFDERFAPAYYEDSDLCFSARRLGWRVVYEPAAVIIHREGATNGVDLRQGVKRWQAVNRERFREKWGEELARHRRGRWHNPAPPGGKSILFIHEMPPLVDQAAGDRRLFELLAGLAARGHAATLFAVDTRGDKARYADLLRARGVMVAGNDWPRWPVFGLGGDAPRDACPLEQLFAENDFDLVVIEFFRVARVYLPLVRRLAPGVPIVVDSVDVHFLREEREARVLADPWLALRAARTREVELAVYGMADGVLAVTGEDVRALGEAGLETPVRVISHPCRVAAEVAPRQGRDGLCFVGNFRHPPNADGVTWFVREVWPRIRARRPDLVFRIGGSAMPDEVRALAGNGVEIVGFVPDLEAFFDRSLVSVAPLRYGAGIKGKVLESMARGLPTVTTWVGAEGMDAIPGRHLLVEDDAEAFADAVLRVVEDPELWETLSREGREFVAARWGLGAIVDAAEDLLRNPPARRPFPAATPLQVDLSRPADPCPAVPGILGVVLAARDPRDAALALGRLRDAHGGDVDAIVLFDGTRREEWHEHAFLGRYRLAVPHDRDLAAVLRAAAPHLAGERVLFAEARLVVFRETLARLREALAAGPGGAVHGVSLPAAPGPDGREPWERAASRARTTPGDQPAELLLCRRDALLAGIADAAPVAGATVIDPARPPRVEVTEPRDPGRLLVAVLDRGEGDGEAWPAEEGVEVISTGSATEDLGGFLAERLAASRAGNLLLVDGRLRPVRPFWPALAGLLAESPAPAATLYPVPVESRLPWPGDYYVGTRLAMDVQGLPGMLYMTLPALLFRHADPVLFEPGTPGRAAAWRAWQRGKVEQPLAVLHDGRRFLVECPRWPGGDEIERDARARARELAEVVRRTDLLPVPSVLSACSRWWNAPPRVRDLVDEMIGLSRQGGPVAEVAWDPGPIAPLLLWFRLELELAPLFREHLESRREPRALAREAEKDVTRTEDWRRSVVAETLAVSRQLLVAAGRPEEGARRLAEALDLAPRNPVVLAVAAEEDLRAGRTGSALARLAEMRRVLVREALPGLWPRDRAVARAFLLETVFLARTERWADLARALDFLEEWHLRPGGEVGRKLLELLALARERLGDPAGAALARASAIALAPGVSDRPPAAPPAAVPTGAVRDGEVAARP